MQKQNGELGMREIKKMIKKGLLLTALILFAVYFLPRIPELTIRETEASEQNDVYGSAWSSSSGWISFSSSGREGAWASVSTGANYGAYIETDGDFRDGTNCENCVWSSNLGWITFSPSVMFPGDDYPVLAGNPGYDCDAKKIGQDIRGWARIIVLRDDGEGNDSQRGWIKLFPHPGDAVSDWGITVGAQVNDTYPLEGIAWSNSVGWIDFNGVAGDASEFGVFWGELPEPELLQGNVVGASWSSNVGWTSLNVVDRGEGWEDVDIDAIYGVYIEEDGGFKNGVDCENCAWNSEIGWITFSPSVIFPSDSYPVLEGDVDYDCDAKVVGNEIRGWARIIILRDDGDEEDSGEGWIKLHSHPDDPNPGWGITVGDTIVDGRLPLLGYAWSADAGWISFDGIALDASTYNVYWQVAITAPTDFAVELSSSSPCNTVVSTWTDTSDNESGFIVERKEIGQLWAEAVEVCNVEPNVEGCMDSSLTPGQEYVYRLKATGDSVDSDWSSEESVETYAICSVNAPIVSGECPNRTIITWNEATASESAVLEYSVRRKTVKDADGNPVVESWVDADGSCSEITELTCTDTFEDVANAKQTYVYKVIITDIASPEPHDTAESGESNEIVPCRSIPSWQEIHAH